MERREWAGAERDRTATLHLVNINSTYPALGLQEDVHLTPLHWGLLVRPMPRWSFNP